MNNKKTIILVLYTYSTGTGYLYGNTFSITLLTLNTVILIQYRHVSNVQLETLICNLNLRPMIRIRTFFFDPAKIPGSGSDHIKNLPVSPIRKSIFFISVLWIRNFSLRIRIPLFDEFRIRIRILLSKSSGVGYNLFPDEI
jgi:hypothetical protein